MPERFGNYDLVRKLAVGGMAEVYLATVVGPEGFHKNVVIKRILPVYSEDPEFVAMFINEARLAAKLQHSNIVQVFDFNRVGDAYYIAMEWVDGVDLERAAQIAKQTEMPIPRVVAIHVACEALKGLRYAHTKTDQGIPLNLVHRDISPPNLMISSSGEVKIADFGIAKVAIQAAATREGFVKGKLAYMAPEQLRGQRADHRSDIFSVGLVLWELLARTSAYGAAVTTSQLMNMVRDGQIQPLTEVDPSIPDELAVVVHCMAAKDPSDRYGSAAEAFDAIRRFSSPTAGLDAANYVTDLLSKEPVAEMPARRTQTFDSGPKPSRSFGSESPAASPTTPPLFASSAPPMPLRSQSSVEGLLPRRRFPLLALAGALALVSMMLSAWGMKSLRDRPAKLASIPIVPLRLVQLGTSEDTYVDGVPIGQGRSQAVIYGAGGETLRVRLRRPSPVTRDVVLGGATEVVLPKDEPSVNENPSASAATPPNASPDAGVRAEPTDVQPSPAPPPTAPESPKQPRPSSDVRHHPSSRRSLSSHREAEAAVDIFVKPWAYVHVDSRDAGITPLKHYPLTPGKHRLRLENPELGRNETRVVTVRPGEVIEIRADWLP